MPTVSQLIFFNLTMILGYSIGTWIAGGSMALFIGMVFGSVTGSTLMYFNIKS